MDGCEKAFDSVAHAWIVKVLEISRVPKIIQEFVKNIMKGWRITVAVNTVNGREQLEPILVRRGILQGDSFVVKLFILCLNPIAWIIRGFEGYQPTHEKGAKITHLLFVDDLKMFAKSEEKIALMTKEVKKMYEDVGMSWGLEKCAAVHVKRGKIIQTDDLLIGEDSKIRVLHEDDKYKFLGKYESFEQLDKYVFKEASEEYCKRLRMI